MKAFSHAHRLAQFNRLKLAKLLVLLAGLAVASQRLISAAAIALAMTHFASASCATQPGATATRIATGTGEHADAATEASRIADLDEIGADSEREVAGVVRVEATYPMSPDPAVIESSDVLLTSYDLIREIHAGLIAVADDPQEPFVPDLAESFEIGDSFTTFKFRLRPGLKFSDGHPLTAADFKWSWERALRLGGREVWLTLGAIEGADQFGSGASSELRGVNVIDDETLEVALARPDPNFLARMAAPASFVLRRENVERWLVNPGDGVPYSYLRSGADSLPAGAGPFAVSAVRIDGVYELVPNAHYHGRVPAVGRIELGDGNPQIDPRLRFESNTLDLFRYGTFYGGDASELPISDIAAGEFVFTESANSLRFLVLNDSRPPFDDVEFRRAVVASLNRNGNLGLRDPSTPRIVANPDAARTHMSSSKYAERIGEFKPTMYVSVPGTFEWEFDVVSRAWSDVLGLQVRYRTADEFAPPRANAEFLIEQAAPTYPSDDSVIELVVSRLAQISDGTRTRMVVELLDEARMTVDPAERRERYGAVSAALVSDALVAPLYWRPEIIATLVRSGIQGFENPKYGGSRFAGVAVDNVPDDN